MKKFILGFSFILLALQASLGQSNSIAPCGTQNGRSPWLKQYQKNVEGFRFSADTLLYIPLSIHIVGDDNGKGYFSLLSLMDALCTLNEDFEPANIRYFIYGEIDYINDSDLYNHETVVDGGLIMLEHNVPNTANVYFVSDPAGNCGYNAPWAGIAMNKGCSGPKDHTWAHELGHHFSLPHPFLGWEGGVSWDNSIAPNFNFPAPTHVTINYTQFKDQLYTDTLIIDTILVEKVDRSNCYEAADGFCDTETDYIAERWNCNNDSESPRTQKDPDGVSFRSDGTLIMSYSDDRCANRFSDEQIQAMRANMMSEKSGYLFDQSEPIIIPDSVEVSLISPIQDEAVDPNEVYFNWTPIQDATHYVLQVSPFSGFSYLLVNEILDGTTTSFTATDLLVNRTLYWRVRAFNYDSPCLGFSASQTFKTTSISSTYELKDISQLSVKPTPVALGNDINIELFSLNSSNAQLDLYDTRAKKVYSERIEVLVGTNNYNIPTKDLTRGMYFLRIIGSGKDIITKRCLIK